MTGNVALGMLACVRAMLIGSVIRKHLGACFYAVLGEHLVSCWGNGPGKGTLTLL